MQHPVEGHLETLQTVLDNASFQLGHETESTKRMKLAENIDSVKWAIRYYKLGLDNERRALAALDEAK